MFTDPLHSRGVEGQRPAHGHRALHAELTVEGHGPRSHPSAAR